MFFSILTTGRSGSSYLRDLLNSRSDCQVFREVLSRIRTRGKGPNAQIRWLRDYYTTRSRKNLQAFGFKTKLKDIIDPELFLSLVRQTECRLIILTRRDSFKHTISRIRSHRLFETTGKWNRSITDNPLPPFHIPIPVFRKHCLHTLTSEKNLLTFSRQLKEIPVLTISYEDLLFQKNLTIARINNFLELAPKKLRSRLVKNTPDTLSDAVLNYKELLRLFQDIRSEFKFMENHSASMGASY